MRARKIYQANIITFTVIQSEEFGDYKCINYSGLLSFGEIPGDLHFALTANWFLSILQAKLELHQPFPHSLSLSESHIRMEQAVHWIVFIGLRSNSMAFIEGQYNEQLFAVSFQLY